MHDEDGLLFLVVTTQNYVDASISAGSDIQFVIALDLNHYDVCDYVPNLRDAAQWLTTIWN